ncbi:D-alanyl-D-alanine carboxypeptidase family protein [Lacrimispora sp. BS-2]|uniref:D-alanyl-D-alanine carboxypeptidase family protein n=1 Tax=Lacrimispora sp. BS-2 TaxID=3151850 RepID=A0AAU7PU85_9FIRM
MTQFTKRILLYFLCFTFSVFSFSNAWAAPEWPSSASTQAQGAILMDADTGTVLWGQNIHEQYYPASITKVMTALIVIENCDLDEMVTFSHNAVYNVEADSSNAGIDEGDVLSVKDCLYALLLKSANESANALAEHIAGSIEAFADMMNARAKELGCTNTHFANPSGLNDPEHYTSAYDMALISRAAFSNPVFEEIDSATYYKLPPNSINPEGFSIYPKHRMMKKNDSFYYPGIIGGKTGYTSLAGNTLVTCVEKNNLKLIAVILKGSNPQYWTDTKGLLDFGFENFVSLKAADYEKTYSFITSDLNFSGLSMSKPEALTLDPDSRIILPKTADFSDAIPELSYDISSGDPEGAIAKINYRYNDRVVGYTFLEVNQALIKGQEEISTPRPPLPLDEQSTPSASDDYRERALRPFEIPLIAWLILGGVIFIAALGGIISFLIYRKHREEQESLIRREQRMRRLQDSGISADEFNSIMEHRRRTSSVKCRGRRRGKFKF